MIKTENHHWVPKFLLRNFASSDGRVFFYDIKSRTVGKRPPKQLASRPNFNDLIVRGEPTSFECVFEKIETRAAPVISQIIAENSLAQVDNADRLKVSRLIATQSFRTDAYRLGLRRFGSMNDIGVAVAAMIDSIEPLATLISQCRWALMRAPKNETFILGDSPLVLQKTEFPAEGGSLGFDVPGVEAMLPISPDLALWMPSREIGDEIVNGYWDALIIFTGSVTGMGNFASVSQEGKDIAKQCLQSGHGLYRGLRHGEAFVAEADNVSNLNALQIFWSSAQLYSNHKDFSFVEHVLGNSPSAGSIIPVRLVQRW